MVLISRPYSSDYDDKRIREFLCQTLLLHNLKLINWPLYRWDYWRWHLNINILDFNLCDVITLWETQTGELAAVLNPENRGGAFLQIHPHYRTPFLVDEMLALAELKFTISTINHENQVNIWAYNQDEILKNALIQRGYIRTEWVECMRWQSLDRPLPSVKPVDGFIIRPQGGDEELPARSWASWRAFHPNEPDNRYEGWFWYRNIQRAPLYRRDLDLVAIGPNGDVASFATVWYDESTRTGAFEPVGTPPQYQRRGLAKALLTTGLHLLQALGATMAYVSSFEPIPHATYEAVGFTQFDEMEMWQKKWKENAHNTSAG